MKKPKHRHATGWTWRDEDGSHLSTHVTSKFECNRNNTYDQQCIQVEISMRKLVGGKVAYGLFHKCYGLQDNFTDDYHNAMANVHSNTYKVVKVWIRPLSKPLPKRRGKG